MTIESGSEKTSVEGEASPSTRTSLSEKASDLRENLADKRDEVTAKVSATTKSVAHVALGIFFALYVFYTIAWVLSTVRLNPAGRPALDAVMIQFTSWCAVIAPLLWFCAVIFRSKRRSPLSFVFLLVGAVLFFPFPFFLGGGIA